MTIAVAPDLCRLAVAVVLHDVSALRAFVAEHPGAGSSNAVRETLLQCHLFCGFPRTISALDLLRDEGLELAAPADSVGDALGNDPRRPPLDEERARGAALFDQIYGSGADDVRAHLARLDPAFARWVSDHAYGRVLSRPGFGAAERELLAVAMLAATGHDRQLASHVRGAVRCGARPDEVHAVLDATADLVPTERLERARQVAGRFARPD